MFWFCPCQALKLPDLSYTFRISSKTPKHIHTNPAKLSLFVLFFDWTLHPTLLLQCCCLSCSLKKDSLWHKRLKVGLIHSLHSFDGQSPYCIYFINLNVIIYGKRPVFSLHMFITNYTDNVSIIECKTKFLAVVHTDGGADSKGVRSSQRPKQPHQCGNWQRNTEGGSFSSPNYPKTYPPNKECLYVLEGNQQLSLIFSLLLKNSSWWKSLYNDFHVELGSSPLIEVKGNPQIKITPVLVIICLGHTGVWIIISGFTVIKHTS